MVPRLRVSEKKSKQKGTDDLKVGVFYMFAFFALIGTGIFLEAILMDGERDGKSIQVIRLIRSWK
jgi:hypothetical protein